MNTFVNSALALAAASSLGFAGTNGSDWAGLDQEINLAAAAGQNGVGGPQIGALIRSSVDFSSDDNHQIGTEDLQGMRFQDVRMWASGEIADFVWRLSFDFASSSGVPTGSDDNGLGDPVILDAYAKWLAAENIDVYFGNFKAPLTASQSVSAGHLLFIDRTLIGQSIDSWDAGVMVGGSMEQFMWSVAVQNGIDDASEDIQIRARGQYNFNAGPLASEGVYGAADGTNGMVGVGYLDEGDDGADGSAIFVDGAVTFDNFSIHAELAEVDEELVTATAPLGNFSDDATPFAITGSFAFNEEFEAGLRFQETDDDDDTSMISAGLSWYQSGHQAKWQLNFSDISSDDDALEGSLIQIGLTIGADA
jgi:hypothetical protein